MKVAKVSFPLYNCPSCGDDRYFAPPSYEFPACTVDGKELPLLTQKELQRAVYVCPLCNYELELRKYFKSYHALLGAKEERKFAVWDGAPAILKKVMELFNDQGGSLARQL